MVMMEGGNDVSADPMLCQPAGYRRSKPNGFQAGMHSQADHTKCRFKCNSMLFGHRLADDQRNALNLGVTCNRRKRQNFFNMVARNEQNTISSSDNFGSNVARRTASSTFCSDDRRNGHVKPARRFRANRDAVRRIRTLIFRMEASSVADRTAARGLHGHWSVTANAANHKLSTLDHLRPDQAATEQNSCPNSI
jgi:hypothetical protein